MKERSKMLFTVIKNLKLSHPIEKNQKSKKNFLVIFHPQGGNQHPWINRLWGEIEKIALAVVNVLPIRASMKNFKSLACLV